MIDYLQAPLGYLLRIPCGDHAADSPLDEPARARAEEAAAFLRYERIGRIYAEERTAAAEAAQISWLSCSRDYLDYVCAQSQDAAGFCAWLRDPDRGLPAVLVATQQGIAAALEILLGANVCGDIPIPEIVAPGGIISIHQATAEGGCATQIAIRARHMILDFAFTDFVKAEAWGHGDLAVEKA